MPTNWAAINAECEGEERVQECRAYYEAQLAAKDKLLAGEAEGDNFFNCCRHNAPWFCARIGGKNEHVEALRQALVSSNGLIRAILKHDSGYQTEWAKEVLRRNLEALMFESKNSKKIPDKPESEDK